MNHTPVPWIVTGRERDEQGPQVFIVSGPNFIATAAPGPNAEANARFIVRACSSHEQLLEALRYYADPNNYTKDDWGIQAVIAEYGDAGAIARDAIKAYEEAMK